MALWPEPSKVKLRTGDRMDKNKIIIESNYKPQQAEFYASIFSLANGYMGLRASQADLPIKDFPVSDGISGTFLNGFYETKDIVYGESAYGFADTGETMQNLANPLPLELRVDGELFDLDEAKAEDRLLKYERKLDLSTGILSRDLTYETKAGKKINIYSRRIVSFEYKTIAVLNYEVTNLSEEAIDISLKSFINERTENKSGGDDPRLAQASDEKTIEVLEHELEDLNIYLSEETKRSKLALAMSVEHSYKNYDAVHAEDKTLVFTTNLKPKKTSVLNKYISIVDEKHASHLIKQALENAKAAAALGFKDLLKKQKAFLDDFYKKTEIKIQGDDSLQEALNFSIFHLLQSAPDDGTASVSAKGLSGEGYEGHYFWDTEMYVLPFFIYTKPEIAKSLLEYRYGILDQARTRAKKVFASKGAVFPWRTISGRELSAYYPAGSAQIHINGDICLALSKYIDATKDYSYLKEQGLEMLIESAVYYLDRAYKDPEKGYTFTKVTGPDEYSAMVNNNYYSNLIVEITVKNLLRYVKLLDREDSQFTEELFTKLGYDKAELLEQFKDLSENIYYPYDERLDIPKQDDDFTDLKPWDFLGVPEENYPLLLHYHPLFIYSHRVSKQADMVLAMQLAPERFSLEELRRAYNYYELVQTHDSSLSVSMYSIVANYLGQAEKAYDYFMETSRLDLDNTHKNTKDGLHLANMAGNYAAIREGYAGLRYKDGCLRFSPKIAKHWNSYSLNIEFEQCLINLEVNHQEVTYSLVEGKGLKLMHEAEGFSLDKEHPSKTFPLKHLDSKQFNPKKLKTIVFTAKDVLETKDGRKLEKAIEKLKELKAKDYHLVFLGKSASGLEEYFAEEITDLNELKAKDKSTLVFTADLDTVKQARKLNLRIGVIGKLADYFLDLKADFALHSFENIYIDDLEYL